MHTFLSPCAELDMYPASVVKECIAQGLDIIAICDHNASENVQYVLKAALGTDWSSYPAWSCPPVRRCISLPCSSMCMSFFPAGDRYEHLSGKNDEDAFGIQAIVNEAGEVEGFNEHLLIGATVISLNGAVDLIHSLGGIAIASHIDRTAFGIIGQLA